MLLSKEKFLGMVDHSILRPETSEKDAVAESLKLAKAGVFSVCVKPSQVRAVSEALEGEDTLVTTVVGFPHGNSSIHVKVLEGSRAIHDGAVELDIVADYSKLLGSDEDILEEVRDLNYFCEQVSDFNDILVKVIIETSHFSEEQLIKVVKALAESKVDFLKTSTGFSSGGATVESVSILKEFGSPKQVKASGGVKSAADAQKFVDAGATRLGCSSTLEVAEQF